VYFGVFQKSNLSSPVFAISSSAMSLGIHFWGILMDFYGFWGISPVFAISSSAMSLGIHFWGILMDFYGFWGISKK
jgi:hypothetical protein